jgi:hypothetical protein
LQLAKTNGFRLWVENQTEQDLTWGYVWHTLAIKLFEAERDERGRRSICKTANARVAGGEFRPNVGRMATVAEIETAIEKLPPQNVEELAAWLDEYRQTLHGSDAVFSLYDKEEKPQN